MWDDTVTLSFFFFFFFFLLCLSCYCYFSSSSLYSTFLPFFYRRLRMNIFLSCPKSVPCRTCWPTTTSITTPISISTSSTPPSASFTVSPFFLSVVFYFFLLLS
jgi:hypothetical protein